MAGPFKRRRRPQDEPTAVSPTVLGCVAGDPATLTTPQVSALWRKSAVGLLTAAGSAEALAEVVAARAVLLAELERRDPASMAAWVAAGAVEAAGPPAYLLGVRSTSSRER